MSVTPSPTVVGVFRDRSVVEQAIEALYQAGFSQDQIRYSVPGNSGGILNDLKSLFTGSSSSDSGDLANDLAAMGLSSDQARYYANEYESGNIVLAVHALDREHEALGVFHQFGAYGINNTLRGAETTNEDATYTQPSADANQPPVGYAQQSTDYEQQLSGYTQRPAAATWDEDADPRHPENDEQVMASDYANNNTYDEQNSAVASVGVADQQNLPDNIEPESVVDHQDLADSSETLHEPATTDEYQASPEDHQEQAAQDDQPSDANATTPEEHQAAEHEGDATDEPTHPIGDGSQAAPYQMPDHATSSEEQSAQDDISAAHAAKNDYPTTVTYDEEPQDSTNDNSISTVHEGDVAFPTTNYTTEPDLAADQERVNGNYQQSPPASETSEYAPVDQQAPVDTATTNGTTAAEQAAPIGSVASSMSIMTPASQREEKLRLLQQRLEAAQQRLQESKTQLQGAKEHESQLQNLKQQLDAIEAELEKNEAELRETHSRIEQYY